MSVHIKENLGKGLSRIQSDLRPLFIAVEAFMEDMQEQFAALQADVAVTGGYIHAERDADLSSADATDLASAVAKANAIKADLNAHLSSTLYHRAGDGTNQVNTDNANAETIVAALTALANELKADYEGHRVMIQDGVHGVADTVNTVTAPNATDLASAITLLNELRVDYESHRELTDGGVHGAADTFNALAMGDASDFDSAVLLANDLKAMFEAHRVLTDSGIHGIADTTHVVTANDASVGQLGALTNLIKDRFNAHRSQTDIHYNDDTNHEITTSDAVDLASAITLLNDADNLINGHYGSAMTAVRPEITLYVET